MGAAMRLARRYFTLPAALAAAAPGRTPVGTSRLVPKSEWGANPDVRPRNWLRTVLASIAAVAVMIVGAVLPTSSAFAAPSDGVTLTANYGGAPYDGTSVVEPGTTYTASLQYDATAVEPGGEVRVTVPDGVTIDADSLDTSGNRLIASIREEDGDLVVTFEDPVPSDVAQGVFSFDFVFDEPEDGSEIGDVSWELDGNPTTVTIIVRGDGDEFKPDFDSAEAKNLGEVSLRGHITATPEGVVSVASEITDVAIPYTIDIDSTDARTITIIDEIDQLLAYNAESFRVAIVTWDENGLNRAEEIRSLTPTIDGNSFTIADLELPANSQATITYTAAVADADALRDALQAEANDVLADDNYDGGPFSIPLDNDATIDGTEDSASVPVGGTVPEMLRPDVNGAFAKSSEAAGDLEIEIDADTGELADPVALLYILLADLTKFADFADTPFSLDSNVVIRD